VLVQRDDVEHRDVTGGGNGSKTLDIRRPIPVGGPARETETRPAELIESHPKLVEGCSTVGRLGALFIEPVKVRRDTRAAVTW
jgi:hypothetical protein